MRRFGNVLQCFTWAMYYIHFRILHLGYIIISLTIRSWASRSLYRFTHPFLNKFIVFHVLARDTFI